MNSKVVLVAYIVGSTALAATAGALATYLLDSDAVPGAIAGAISGSVGGTVVALFMLSVRSKKKHKNS